MPQPSNSAGLRSRKIDHKKALYVFRSADLEDEAATINRALLNISTGVEKEEEEVGFFALISEQN